jgi:hypothetical protein
MTNDSRYHEALISPSEVYDDPRAVLRDETLSDSQKREILEHWEAEAVRLQESEAEGFTGGERTALADIKKALKEL